MLNANALINLLCVAWVLATFGGLLPYDLGSWTAKMSATWCAGLLVGLNVYQSVGRAALDRGLGFAKTTAVAAADAGAGLVKDLADKAELP